MKGINISVKAVMYLKPKNKKILIAFISLFLAFTIPVGVIAVKNGSAPKSSSGGYYSTIVNRVDFSVSATDFVLEKAGEGTETFLLNAQIGIRKCEPDFFVKIKSIEITGMKVNYTVFTALEGDGENYFPENLILRDSETHTWNTEISFDALYPNETQAQLIIEYESGITADTADAHRLTVPISISVVSK